MYILIYLLIALKTRGFNNDIFVVRIIDKYNGYFIGVVNNRKIVLLGNTSGLSIGDFVLIKGNFVKFNGALSNGYNEKIIFYSKNIFDKFDVVSNEIKGSSNTPHVRIRKFIFNGNIMYTKYVSLILVGIKNSDNSEVYSMIKELGVVHLFVISGFHIGLLYFSLDKLFNIFKVNKSYSSLIIMLIILMYLYLLNFPVASTRAFLFLSGLLINKHWFKNRLDKIGILSIVTMMFIIYNPYVVYSLSFIMSFLAMFLILFILKLKIQSSGKLTITVGVILYFAMLPITINLNHYFSIFSIIFSIVLSPIIGFYYLLTLFLFPFKDLMFYVYQSLDFILKSFSSINILIEVNEISFPVIFSYYIIYTVCILYGEKINILLTSMKRKSRIKLG